MTSTTVTDDFSLTYWNQTCFIQMPANFTSVEANSFNKLFHKLYHRDFTWFRRSSFRLCQNSSTIKKIILDFGQTINMDSSGLVGLCQIIELANNEKFDLTFYRFSPQVKMLLSLAGLEPLLTLDDTSNAIITDGSISQTNSHTITVSPRESLFNICHRVLGLGMISILFLPITIATKLNQNNFLPKM